MRGQHVVAIGTATGCPRLWPPLARSRADRRLIIFGVDRVPHAITRDHFAQACVAGRVCAVRDDCRAMSCDEQEPTLDSE